MVKPSKNDLLKFWGIRMLPKDHAAPSSGSAPSAGVSGASKSASSGPKNQLLAKLAEQVAQSEKCGLRKGCTNLVFGEGNPDADIVFVGEAPGFEEDKQGRPFVGRAGQLLTDIITKGMGLDRGDVYICNVLKCRPPQNRTPTPEEIIACSPYLNQQLKIIQPKVIIALGASAVRALLPDVIETISKTRGHFFDYHLDGPGTNTGEIIKLMPTFHPAYLLRNPAAKAKVWDDIKKVMTHLNMPIPSKRG